MPQFKYGCLPDATDHRDFKFSLFPLSALPEGIDLRAQCCPIYDQGQLSSCTAHAIAAAIRYDLKRQGLPDVAPSRLFIYFWERMLESTVDSDNGAMIRDGIKVVSSYGIADEQLWPYDAVRFADDPMQACYASADRTHAVRYERIDGFRQLKQSLALGFPVVLGFTVYSSFESDTVAKTGNAPMPGKDEQLVGGHAVLAVGYNDTMQKVLLQNSWGDTWGCKGFFTLPYAYFQQDGLVSDMWSIRLIDVEPERLAA